MEESIFAKIIKGDIPSYKLYEDNDTFSFLDIMPGNKGHALVVPKQQYADVEKIPEELLCSIIATAKKVGQALKQAVGCQGYNLLINNGTVAGQVVGHVHMHVIPRFKGDGLELSWAARKYPEQEMKEVQQSIQKFLS